MGLRIIAIALFALLLAPGGADAAGDIAFASATQGQATTEEKPQPPAAPSAAMAEFSLTEDDILAWEENETGQYVYVALTAEKNKALAASAAAQPGQALRLNIGDDYVIIPQVAENFRQEGGFLLTLGDSKRQAFIYSVMDRAKRRAATTSLAAPVLAPAGAAPLPIALPPVDSGKKPEIQDPAMKREDTPAQPDSNP